MPFSQLVSKTIPNEGFLADMLSVRWCFEFNEAFFADL